MKTSRGSWSFLAFLSSALCCPAQADEAVLTGLYAPTPLVAQGPVTTEQDRWGRFSVTDETVRMELLKQGQAQLMPEAREPTLGEWRAEEAARQAGLGVWNDDCCKLLKASGKIPLGQWRVVQGLVHSVSIRREVAFVNFAADWKTDFTLILKPALAKKLKIENWQGRTLQVRGWTEWYYGPAIRVDVASQIRLPAAGK